MLIKLNKAATAELPTHLAIDKLVDVLEKRIKELKVIESKDGLGNNASITVPEVYELQLYEVITEAINDDFDLINIGQAISSIAKIFNQFIL